MIELKIKNDTYDLDDLSLNDLYRLRTNLKECFRPFGARWMSKDEIEGNIELQMQITRKISEVERKNRDVLLGKNRS